MAEPCLFLERTSFVSGHKLAARQALGYVTLEEADEMVRYLLDEMMTALASADVDLIHHYMRLSRAWDSVREQLFRGCVVTERPELPVRHVQG